jgi:hypothetical protein
MAQGRLAPVVDDGVLAAIGAAIVGFGIVAFVFRVQRELQVAEEGQVSWLPWADRLLIGVVVVALLLVLFPIALAGPVSGFWGRRLPAAACSAAAVALSGYIPALLAHYRFGGDHRWIWFGAPSPDLRQAGEPAEKAIVLLSALFGGLAAAGSFVLTG